jgi:hypothetical protein
MDTLGVAVCLGETTPTHTVCMIGEYGVNAESCPLLNEFST